MTGNNGQLKGKRKKKRKRLGTVVRAGFADIGTFGKIRSLKPVSELYSRVQCQPDLYYFLSQNKKQTTKNPECPQKVKLLLVLMKSYRQLMSAKRGRLETV